jgi:hypothetical protein
MATTATPWIGSFGVTDKLYLQSGQFTSTIKDSESTGAIEATGNGISWDGTNTPWCGNTDDKLYLQSGQFTSTLKTSQGVISQSTYIAGITYDGNDTPWCAGITQKLYLTSGQFTSTIKTSQGLSSTADDISADETNTPWLGSADKLYLQSGRFTSTIKTSEDISSIDTEPTGISWDGTNTPWSGKNDIKLYLQSGQFSSTIKTSQTLSGVNYPESISTDDFGSRIGAISKSVSDTLTLSDQVNETIIRVPRPTYALNDTLTFSEEAGYYSGVSQQTDTLEFDETVTVTSNNYRVADVLVFTEVARQPLVLELTATDSLTFTEVASGLSNNYSVSDSFAFIEHADLRGDYYDIVRHAVEALTLTDSIAKQTNIYSFHVSDTITFVENIIKFRPYNEYLTDTLVFVETADPTHPYNIEVVEYFNYTYTPDGQPFAAQASFIEVVDRQITRTRRGNETLTFVESVNVVNEKVGAVSKSVSDTLTFTESAARVYGDTDTITFTESAEVEVCNAAKDTLTFTESLTYSQQASYALTDTLSLESTVSYTLISASTLCNYSPFIGNTTQDDAPAPPANTATPITTYDNVYLFYPPDNPTDTLTLRGPELDNRHQLTYSRISRETRGGTLIIYSDPIWPQTQKLLLSFVGLSETEAQDALTFVKLTLGKQIGLRDWEGNEWSGLILTPDNPITRNHDCNLAFDVEFEGVAAIRETSADSLTFVETVELEMGYLLTESITFVEGVSYEHIQERSVSDSISFVEAATISRPMYAVDSLTFVDDVSYEHIQERSVSDSITFVDDTSYEHIQERSVSDSITFVEAVPSSRPIHNVDTITLVDSIDLDIIFAIDTLYTGNDDDKLYLQSGQFTTTLKTSQSTTGFDVSPLGITWDGTNTPIVGAYNDKMYLVSGQFSSTVKTSYDFSAIESQPTGICWDGTDTPWCGRLDDKLYLQSGQFTSTLKTSLSIGGIDTVPVGISAGANNTEWIGSQADKLYLQSGRFSSTIKDSQYVGGTSITQTGVAWDGINSLWCDALYGKLYRQSGQFTATLQSSVDVSSVEIYPWGIATDNETRRMGAG